VINIARNLLGGYLKYPTAELNRIIPTNHFDWILSRFKMAQVITYHLFELSLRHFLKPNLKWLCKRDLLCVTTPSHQERADGNQLEVHADGKS
jgi:hypothetical protein